MNSADNSSAATNSSGRLSRIRSDPRTLLLGALAALLLISCALGLRRIALINTDLESLPQLAADLRSVYGSTSDEPPGVDGAWWKNHASGLRAWKLGWLSLNGQIDSRVLHLGALALRIGAIAALFFALAARRDRRWAIALAVGIVLLFETPALAGIGPSANSTWGSGLVLFSLLHLTLMSRNAVNSFRWWLGLACGATSILSATEGIASAIALAGWSALAGKDPANAPGQRLPRLLANTLLFVGGIALAVVRAKSEGSPAFTFSNAALLGWPFPHRLSAIVMWIPAAGGIALFLRKRGDCAPLLAQLALLAIWAAVAALTLSAGSQTMFAAADVFAATVAINAAGFAALPGGDTRLRTRNLVLFAAWLIGVGYALVNPLTPPLPRRIEPDTALTASLRQALMNRDSALLRHTTDLVGDDLDAAVELVADKNHRAILPASLRVPLPIAPAKEETGLAFRPGNAPELPARDGLPALGTDPARGGVATGEFISAPIATSFPLLQLRIAGTLHPPATSLVLRTGEGREIQPLGGASTALDKWRRINFEAPRGPFQIVARDSSATEWLAFTAPTEIGTLSRLAGKLPRCWPWLLTAGLGIGAGVGVTAWRRTARAESAPSSHTVEPFVNWRVVPWITLCGYAVFFSSHLDTVAGPNDSGGYLNLAKTLVEGHVTAAPRMLFGASAGETDITPYLTTTFQPLRDGRMSAEYPVGFPLEIWAFAQFLPLEKAVSAVILIQLVLGVVFTRLLAKAFGLPEGWAWLAGGMVGASAVYLFQALQPQSDGPALVWVTAAVYWAWSSREKPWHAVLAGGATTLAVLIRPSNLLCVVPVLLCLAGNWRQTLGWALAGLPGAA
ncbi:MAG: hypothetical protein ABIO94_08705, partial [Opitutaceae bacterium]